MAVGRASEVQVPRQSPSAEEVLLRVQAGHEKQRAVKDMVGSEAPLRCFEIFFDPEKYFEYHL